MNVDVLVHATSRSQTIAQALMSGISRAGDRPRLVWTYQFDAPKGEVVVHYGLAAGIQEIQKQYKEKGKPRILLDLGYFGRHFEGRFRGYHRFAINGLHGPLLTNAPGDRIEKFRIKIRRPKESSLLAHWFLAGMSAKAAMVYGIEAGSWERKMVRKIREQSDRKIIYYPKLSWKGAWPIEGTEFYRGVDHDDLENAPMFLGSYALISHHSNLALRALVKGIPIFVEDGIAVGLSGKMDELERPRIPDPGEVQQLLNAVAYQQWNVSEIERGEFWTFMREKRLNSEPTERRLNSEPIVEGGELPPEAIPSVPGEGAPTPVDPPSGP